MKKFIVFLIAIVFAFSFGTSFVCHAEGAPMIAIVIDDFGGEDRHGIDNMLALDIPITCAVMPNLSYTTIDANKAHENGKDVILHMPMQANGSLPLSWYGPELIFNSDSDESAKVKLNKCIKQIPHIIGVNSHIGTGVSENKRLMKAIIEETRNNGLFYLDSKAAYHSVCDEIAKANSMPILSRDVFLEETGNKSVALAKRRILDAIEIAKTQGQSIIIGHVGAQGGESTYIAIKDMIPQIKESGIKIVPLSHLAKLNHALPV